MKQEIKRVFISDLPETATEDEIRSVFNNYGKVRSVEIKERKELGPKNSSLFFSYVNLETDDRNLQQCFQEFANTEWHGQYVKLQIAKESFLERLKREREETGNKTTTINNSETPATNNTDNISTTKITNGYVSKKIIQTNKKSSSESEDSSSSNSSSSDSEEDEEAVKIKPNIVKNVQTEELDIVIKNNRNKVFDKGSLKIESVGNEPIITIERHKKQVKSKDPKRSEADVKRQQSLSEKIKGYNKQKSLIQAALSNVDGKLKNKIVFNEDEDADNSKSNDLGQSSGKNADKSRKSLFDENESEEEDDTFKANFEIKEQFQGKKGQKLMELQSRYKNDKRFALDERFLEQEEEEPSEETTQDTFTIEEEKQQEFKILEEVLGKKIAPKSTKQTTKKKMLRYDPTQEDHSQYEVKVTNEPSKKKRKLQDPELEIKQIEQPEVSKEIFYEVKDTLKESFQEKNEGFSLLNMFSVNEEPKEHEVSLEEVPEAIVKNNKFGTDRNPFKYDSSEDEDDNDNTPNKTEASTSVKSGKEGQRRDVTNITRLWTEPFFFKKDDFRFQEGYDFMKRIATEEKSEFGQLRKDLKYIVKSKVKNNLSKKKMFKKKLGGKKKKQMKRIEKALNR